MLADIIDISLVSSVLRALTPVLLAALGGALCARAGVFNVGLEGFMLIGAFAAVAGSWFGGSAWIGVGAAVLAGAATAAVLSVASIRLGGGEIIVGIALNLLAVGLTAFLLRTTFGTQGTFTDPALQGLPTVGGQTPLTYLAWALVPILSLFLRRHVWGFRLQGVGEAPEAAHSLGVNPATYRHAAVLASGVLCGLAGAQLALGNVVLFSQNMTAGRGWVAVVAVMLGQAAPFGVLFASLLFATTEAIGFRLQGLGLPSQVASAAPYALTLLALVAASLRSRGLLPARPSEPHQEKV
ncbi:ABC transporter permease [Pseudonocardia sichuanensis]|uniref:Nucleoside ABC transporter membrane protein n=1 Tax=Pseudonocardia kunmingensis TaxID=630975 RepID=A0A543DJL3_9PSEU|nr:ABC transporter permease [Pseudonocardia kunmingensis]TQM09522.1 nucleoside ABC transporter membrane protein [Pseudonocardia kunmingensis]